MNEANEVGLPEVGVWYRNTELDETFQVVSVDAASATVQTQAFEGEVDSIDVEDWAGLPLVMAPPPEDWTGPMDEVEADDVTEDDSPSDRAG